MTKIAFWDNCLCERGTTVALYDYAYFNKTILGNESIILYKKNNSENDENVIMRFKKEFEVYGVIDFDEVDPILLQTKCDIFYIIKGGWIDNQVSKVIKTAVHCVFNCNHPHGDVYASIAPWVNGNNGKYPFVPHMINLPDHNHDMREQLNIPKNATVYGRHGNYDGFDNKITLETVHRVAKENSNIYFVFVNTKPFCENLPNIIHLGRIYDLNEKVKFINTCDAMIWGGSHGEVFSLAIGEFCVRNKPIICMDNGSRGQVHLLGDKGVWYNSHESLYQILTRFNRDNAKEMEWNAYKQYTPEYVMDIFKKVFITGGP